MKLIVLRVGDRSPEWADAACHDYGRRLRTLGGVAEQSVRGEPFRGDVEAVRAAETDRLLALVTPRDRLVALDERGLNLDADAFLSLFQTGLEAEGRLVFALGGAYGHHDRLRKAAWRTLRLSSLVLNHEVARVVLYEQLYRAWARQHNVPYHH